MKRLFQIGFLMVNVIATQAQAVAQNPENTRQALQFFDALQQTYQNTSGLSFDMKYTYSNETKPDIVLDSLTGTFKMSRNEYNYILDSTETIKNDKYTIVLFKEDKVMYLTKANASIKTSPLEVIGEFFKANKGISCDIVVKGKFKVISINYPPGLQYKQISLTVDTTIGYLVNAMYIVQTKLLFETESIDKTTLGQYDEYARVGITFFNYREAAIDTADFDENKFFLRDGKNFKPTEAYKNYKIFIGSVNL